jgi:hypothetical protein
LGIKIGCQDDPKLTLLKITPSDAYYRDTKNSKMVSFFKIVISTIPGKGMDDGGIERNLDG